MAWPLSQDYNEALQNPQTSFSDAELRQGEVVTNALGIPQPCSGNFADVYAVECAASKTKWAVKCFTREVQGLRERYSEISKYVQQIRLPFTVDFQYLEQGIRIRGQWYPILKMHWVEGFTLNAFVRDMLDKPAMLDALGQIWLRMGRRLREANLAHCDLQHGNVLLVPGSTAQSLAVKLIDYDGMWVPALARAPSGEVGHPAYQHAWRLRDGTYNADVDRFPLLVIATALRCLRVGGRALWERYDTGDNMLFREVDLRAPAESPLFAELRQINDPLARSLVEQLWQASQKPLEQTPLLHDLIPDEKPPVTRGKAPATARTATAGTTEVNAFQDMEAANEEKRSRRRSKRGTGTSVVPWIVGAVVAVCILGGGALLWTMRSKNPPKPPVTPEQQHARTKRGETTKKLPLLPGEKSEPDSRPPIKTKKDKPPKSAMVQLLDGPPGEVRHFEGHAGDVIGVAFSPDGKRALSASSDKTLRLWDVAGGETIRSLNGHTAMVWAVAFSPDGKRAVSAAYDKSVRVWDLAKGEVIQNFRGHANPVRRAVFSPDSKQVYSAGWDRMVRLWDVENGREVRHYEGNKSNPYWMALSPDGKRVLSAGGDRDIHCWDTASGAELEPYKGNTGDVYAIEFSRDGQFVAASGGDQIVRIWRTSEPSAPLHSLSGHTGVVNAVAFTPDGRLLSASHDGTVRLWDVATGRELARFYGPEGGKILSVAVSSDGRHFLSGGSDHMLRLWRLPPPDVLAAKPDAAAGEVQSFAGHMEKVRRVAFSFDGRHILSAGYDNTARLWETATGREVRAFREHKHPHVHTVAFLPDDRRALSGGQDRVLRLWDLKDGHEIRALEGSTEGVFNLAVSPNGQRVASSGPEPAVLLWDLEKGEMIRRLEGLGVGANRVCFSPDGRQLLASGGNGTMALWDVKSDEPKPRLFLGHSGSVASIGFSPDGRQILSAAQDRTLRLWDVESGKELRRYEGHTDQIEGAALSPDGRRAISGGFDKTVRLWDVATGKELHHFEGHTDKIWDVAFSPDGRYVLSASEDKSMKLWRVPFVPLVFGRPLEIKDEPAPVPAPIAAKLPVPNEAAQKKWTDDIRENHKPLYDSKNAIDRAKLADLLLERGRKKSEQPEARYVYLVEASDVAAKAGDAVLSLRAVDELGKLFVIAETPMKAAALQTATKAAKTLDANKAILDMVLPMLEETIQADDYDTAERLAKTALLAAAQTRTPTQEIQFLANKVKRLKPKYPAVKLALATLAKEPNDPKANLLVGSFRCFDKGDWEAGLPLLALGEDAKLKMLAEKDIEMPPAADAREAVGDGWWKLVQQRVKGPTKANIQQRACYWYGLALADAVEKNRVRMEKNIRRHNIEYPVLAWGHLNISQATGTLGALRLDKRDKQISTRESYSGPIEITLLARTEKNNIRLHGGKGAYLIFNHESEPGAVELGRPDGEKPYSGSKVRSRIKPLRPNTWYLLSWRISEEGMSAEVNGREVFSEEHKNNLSEKQPIHVQTFDSAIEVLSFTVRPLKKKSG